MPLTLPVNTVTECLRTDCYMLGDKKIKEVLKSLLFSIHVTVNRSNLIFSFFFSTVDYLLNFTQDRCVQQGLPVIDCDE